MSDNFRFQQLAAHTIPPLAEATPHRVRRAQEMVATLHDGARVLDVGCSDGAIMAPFVGRFEVHGVDASEALVAAAQAKGIRARVCDVEELPYGDGEFDAIFAGEVIEHQLSTDRFLTECNRVLKQGGLTILTIPNIRTPVSLAMMLYGLPPLGSARYRSPHVRDFTAKTARIALANNGFRVESLTGSAFTIPPFGQRLSMLAALLPTWSDNLIIKAVKVRDVVYHKENDVEVSLKGY
jgi:2-polyprenyl-3-methyl-5-hydroxy-6-metoxy-1,4-benzoquinol methylase